MKINQPAVLPLHLIADPTPSEDDGVTYILRTADPASLWWTRDDVQINLVKTFEPLDIHSGNQEAMGQTMARVAREVGDFYAQYKEEEDALA